MGETLSTDEVAHRPPWDARAPRRWMGPDIFFVERGRSREAAKATCAGCLVREECLEAAANQRPSAAGAGGGGAAEGDERLHVDQRINPDLEPQVQIAQEAEL